MMRIKEAIQRKKLIHEMNEEWKDLELELGPLPPANFTPSPDIESRVAHEEEPSNENPLLVFVQYLSLKLTDYQKRALKVTWKRLSEAPKTSGRGTIHIMEKVLNKVCDIEPEINAIFYKSAFLSCIEDRKCGRTRCLSIATIRDHAHILAEFIDAILQTMFEGPVCKPGLDPDSIGVAHSRLAPLGFDRRMWHVLGECFAEVMFMQDCIRAYPHAPSAWSLLSVAMTDKMYASGKASSSSTQSILFLDHHPTFDRIPRVRLPHYKNNISDSFPQSSITKDDDQSTNQEQLCTTAQKFVKRSSLEHDKPLIFKRQQSDIVILPHIQSRTVSLTSVMRETAIEPPDDFKKYALPITHNL